MANKSPSEDYMHVKEFAVSVEIGESMLRHYDREGIFVAQRDKNGYRVYNDVQITAAKMLRVFSDIGFKIGELKQITLKRSPQKVMHLLLSQRDKNEAKGQRIQEAQNVIAMRVELLNEALSLTPEAEADITICDLPERPIILGGINSFVDSDRFIGEFMRFRTASHSRKLCLSHPVGGYFNNMDIFLAQPSLPTRFFSIDPHGYERRERGLYLTGYTRGYYGQTNDLPARMAKFAKLNGYIFNGPVYNIYLTDEVSELDHSRYLLKAIAAVKETNRSPTQYTLNRF
jgi:DNA-binding transcriptional MerR regulator